ncbi:unnamed protein product, partial [Laminaria digitata]
RAFFVCFLFSLACPCFSVIALRYLFVRHFVGRVIRMNSSALFIFLLKMFACSCFFRSCSLFFCVPSVVAGHRVVLRPGRHYCLFVGTVHTALVLLAACCFLWLAPFFLRFPCPCFVCLR